MRTVRSVYRALDLVVVALAVASASACADVEPAAVDASLPVPDAAPDGFVIHLGDASLAEVPCQSELPLSVTLDPRRADVLIVLDRSGSMETAFGSGTRIAAVSAALSDIVQTYASHVRFGFEEMPGRQACPDVATSTCCASPPVVPVADANAPAILSALAAAGPMDGNTPTAGALQTARTYFQSLDDGVDNRYVLLATDGVPSCTTSGKLASGTPRAEAPAGACADALAQVDALMSVGIRVIVLGVGQNPVADVSGSTACLDSLAHAGGAAASPGSPGFFATTDPLSLQQAMEQIFGGVSRPSCRLQMDQPLEDAAYQTAKVFLDGRQILTFDWDRSKTLPVLVLTGTACESVQRFEATSVQVTFVCPSSPGSGFL